jgi:uncharacterized membrane protein
MRLQQSIDVEAPPQRVWDYLAEPSNYLDFMVSLTRWEVIDRRGGVGDRFRMLIHVGAADVGGLIEVVEWNPPRDMAFTSVTGVDQRGRWRLRERGEGRTRVEFRYAYGVAGGGIAGLIAERISAPTMRRDLRRSLVELKRIIERGYESSEESRRALRTA